MQHSYGAYKYWSDFNIRTPERMKQFIYYYSHLLFDIQATYPWEIPGISGDFVFDHKYDYAYTEV